MSAERCKGSGDATRGQGDVLRGHRGRDAHLCADGVEEASICCIQGRQTATLDMSPQSVVRYRAFRAHGPFHPQFPQATLGPLEAEVEKLEVLMAGVAEMHGQG